MIEFRSTKRIVFTCLVGKYESLNEQNCQNTTNIPFICFTDQDITSKSWKIRPLPRADLDNSRESRRPKLLPHVFLPEYDESLYIDNTVVLSVDPVTLFEKYLPLRGPGLACLRHPIRDCIYSEAEEIIKRGIDDEARVREQMDGYRCYGFPAKAGLIAGTVILRRHHQPDVVQFDNMWFQHVLRYSKRDQLSFPFCAWRQQFKHTTIDKDLTSNELFRWPVGERPIPYGFKREEYLWLNPDVAKAGVDAQDHMFAFGHRERRPFRHHQPVILDILANKYKSDKGSIYYNRHFYSRVYEHYLSSLRCVEMTVVEIGLLRHDAQWGINGSTYDNAPSLFMWDEYFERAQIHGIDIADFSCAARGKITFARADQSKPEQLLAAVDMCKHDIRVIIDDASHASHHQQISLACLFPRLASGGMYFIEDLHYQPPHLEVEDVPKTRDYLMALQRGERPYSPFVSAQELEYLTREIVDIRFFDSMDYAAGIGSANALAVIVKR